MEQLTPAQAATLKPRFLPERPGPLIGLHVLHTGNGTGWVDRWPDPQAVLMENADNYAFHGDAQALTPTDVQAHIQRGFIEAPEPFVPLLKAAFPDLRAWPRVVAEQRTVPDLVPDPAALVRCLEPSDTASLHALDDDCAWISKTWGGPSGLAASGFGWGAFVGAHLVSVACTFFLGATYEEIGVVTAPTFRGARLSVACAAALCRDIWSRGHRPGWTTSPDNAASLRVADQLAFAFHRHDWLYVVGLSIPEPAKLGTAT